MGKITNYTELAETPADDDEFVIVDVSDTSMAPTGTTKRVKKSNLGTGGGSGGPLSNAISQTLTVYSPLMLSLIHI